MEFADSWAEIGARVRESRIALGLTQAQLAERLGLDRTALAKAEAGDRRLDALELFRLSDALGLPLGHFIVRPPAAMMSRRRVALAEDTETAALREGYLVEARLVAWLWDVQQMVDLGYLRPAQPYRWAGPVESEADARAAAAECRRQLKVGRDPLGSMVDACERLGLLVLVSDVPGEGASVTDGPVGVAIVADRYEPGRRRATAAHELGHQVLGDEYSTDLGVAASRGDRESVIDAFAAELLVPADDAAAAWPVHSAEADCREAAVQLAARYRVSWSLLLRQLQRTDLLPPAWRARWTARPPTRAELLDAAGWEREPPEDLARGEVPPGYARSVFDAFRAGEFTPARAVELLHGWIAESDLPEQDLPEPAP
jgi:transcriptional regulator with XRE-family HTH domain